MPPRRENIKRNFHQETINPTDINSFSFSFGSQSGSPTSFASFSLPFSIKCCWAAFGDKQDMAKWKKFSNESNWLNFFSESLKAFVSYYAILSILKTWKYFDREFYSKGVTKWKILHKMFKLSNWSALKLVLWDKK